MDDIDPFEPILPTPTTTRPLLGLTVLAVEDSRFACEAIRLLCLRSGARIRRADSLRSARRHLRVYRPSVVIVDIGLPDGDGTDLIRDLVDVDQRVSVVIATSGQDDLEGPALAAGADAFLHKPIHTLSSFQETILAALPSSRQPAGPRVLSDEVIEPDPIAYQDDIAHIADVLGDFPNERVLDYVAQFLSGVARSAADERMEKAATALAQRRAEGEMATVAGLIQDRLSHRIAI